MLQIYIRYTDVQPRVLCFTKKNHRLFNCFFFLYFLKMTALWVLKAKQCNQYHQLVKHTLQPQPPKIKRIHILTYVWVLNRSEGPLVHTLSPSNPITLLQMFILGSNGLFAIMTSPLKRKNICIIGEYFCLCFKC